MSEMTAREAMETIVREAAEAGVEFGPAGKDERFREQAIERMDAVPGSVPFFLERARETIAARRA